MDLFGDMLLNEFQAGHVNAIEVERLRPALRCRISKLPGLHAAGFSRNADRLLNRFYCYPAWLKRRAKAFDLFHLVDHSYSHLILNLPQERVVVTCHDLDTFKCLLEPDAEPRPRWFRAMAQRILDGFLNAAHVICVSDFTRSNLLRHGLFAPERLSVIHPGVDPVFFSAGTCDQSEHAPIIRRDETYLLHVGSTIQRKRIDILLRVFARIAAEDETIRLVRVGGAFTAEQRCLAEELKIAARIVQSPPLTKQQLAAVYRNAACVLQTSESEGFGLPVIESMACGCPVVASDIAPLREAGGPAADYCAVGDVESWAGAVIRLLQERRDSPDTWELRRERVRRHAQGYSWTENANRTILVYNQLTNRQIVPANYRRQVGTV